MIDQLLKLLMINKNSKTKEKNSFFSKLSLLSSKTSIGDSKVSMDRSRKLHEAGMTSNLTKEFLHNTKKLSNESIVSELSNLRKSFLRSL